MVIKVTLETFDLTEGMLQSVSDSIGHSYAYRTNIHLPPYIYIPSTLRISSDYLLQYDFRMKIQYRKWLFGVFSSKRVTMHWNGMKNSFDCEKHFCGTHIGVGERLSTVWCLIEHLWKHSSSINTDHKPISWHTATYYGSKWNEMAKKN